MDSQPQRSDDVNLAVVELIRAARNDGRLQDSPTASLRQRIVKSHVDAVAEAYGLDAKELALAAAEMMSWPEGLSSSRVSPPRP